MSKNSSQLVNSFSSGGGGHHFESHVQASYVVLMLSGGFAPCIQTWPITKIKLQGKVEGYDTDDAIVCSSSPTTGEESKLLIQIKNTLQFQKEDLTLRKVLSAAWFDYKHSTHFNNGKDRIAIVTGPLSKTDTDNVAWLMDEARCTEFPDQYFERVGKAKFSSVEKDQKLEIIEHHLNFANNNDSLQKEEFYSFLRHLHLLGYDLGREEGVVLSLLHSHIATYGVAEPRWLWGRIVDFVQDMNKHAGIITLENIPKDIRDVFVVRQRIAIPPELSGADQTSPDPSSSIVESKALAQALLLGGWDESSERDLKMIQRLTGQAYTSWVEGLHESLEDQSSPLKHRNGIWRAKRKPEFWEVLGRKLFDADLQAFEGLAMEVLSEDDPAFELPPEERYMANVKGKTLTSSGNIRDGLANSLAVLGSRPGFFPECSINQPSTTALLVVRHLLEHADTVRWGSLNNLLPLLAEASPVEFLRNVEKAITTDSSPFLELFAQEGKGMFSRNYLTGLLWALENIAWEKEFLTQTLVLLSDLHEMDPGGNWANRPINSLTTIVLPWMPQTTAGADKRILAVQSVVKECPLSAWDALMKLLPGQHQTSSGSHTPKWRQSAPEDTRQRVSQKEYWEQASAYAEMALDMARDNTEKLAVLIEKASHLPKAVFQKLIRHLSSPEVKTLPENERTVLWNKLVAVIRKHKRYADADWAFSEENRSKLENIAEGLAVKNPVHRFKLLFDHHDHELFAENSKDWRKQEKDLYEKRKKAVEELIHFGGLELITQLVEEVKHPNVLGTALAAVKHPEADSFFLPGYLEKDPWGKKIFIASYIWKRQQDEGWEWTDSCFDSQWSLEQKAMFLWNLPFCMEAWRRVEKELKGSEDLYWKEAFANPHQAGEDVLYAVDKLLEYERPNQALECLYITHKKNQPVERARIIRALTEAVEKDQSSDDMRVYHAVELIKALQTDPETNPDDLFRIEWAYLKVLDGSHGARAKTLEQKLSSDPTFFHSVIEIVYLSKFEEKEAEIPEGRKRMAEQGYELLNTWKSVPGVTQDSVFEPELFNTWLDEVKRLCNDSGHLDIAMQKIGEVLIHAPGDPSGLWIHKTAAEALNARDADNLRTGFHIGRFNSGGASWGESDKSERKKAEECRNQAEAVDGEGFFRLAATLRDLADSYTRTGERFKDRHADLLDDD